MLIVREVVSFNQARTQADGARKTFAPEITVYCANYKHTWHQSATS